MRSDLDVPRGAGPSVARGRSMVALLSLVACGTDAPLAVETMDESGEDRCVPAMHQQRSDVPYVVRDDPASDARTRLDIYPPAEEACGRPIVVWVHGGAWHTGDKSNNLMAKIPFVHELGATLVSINYRLSSADGMVQHPDHVEDVAAAVAWIRANATEFGGDPERIALLGHSAGAHLSALVATNARFLAPHGLEPSALACIGSYDTEYSVAEIVARDPAYETVFTGDPEVWADASPRDHVGPGAPPFQLACRGTRARVAQCEAFANDIREAGGHATIIDASALSHAMVNEVLGRTDDPVMTPHVRTFLEQCFRVD